MKTVSKFILSTLCAAVVTASAFAQDKNEMVTNAMKYIGVPYVAHTLEGDGEEELVVNCDEVDCTTFVEYVLAESLAPKQADGDVLEGDFAEKLMQIRYRDGKLDGYTSRLHYIADWVNNGVRNGFLQDITGANSNDQLTVALNYMSTHPQLYKQLADSKENVAKMKQIEDKLNGQTFCYLPKEKLPVKGLPWIKDGDIIAFTTATPGLDVSHLGIAFYVDDRLTVIHASYNEKQVVISSVALSKMLQESEKLTGIRVLRMNK